MANATLKVLLSAVIFFGCGAIANAETVRVGTGASQAHGHGYVFGSSTDASCWLVAPAHVLENTYGDLVDQIIVNKDGLSGVATNALRPDKAIDLAFAEVKGLGQKCVDRLSSRDLDGLLEVGTDTRLNLTNSSNGGAKTLPLRIRSVDGGSDALYFSIEPIASAADENPKIIQGYSGGVIDKNGSSALGGGDQVLGLILNVCDGSTKAEIDFDYLFNADTKATAIPCSDGHYGTAIRMDMVKSIFEAARQDNRGANKKAERNSAPTFLSFTGNTISGNPSNLLNGGGCWSVEEVQDEPITLNYLLPEGTKVSQITISFCTPKTGFKGVEIRGGASPKKTKPYRYCPAEANSVSCSIGVRRPRILTLRMTADRLVNIRSVKIN